MESIPPLLHQVWVGPRMPRRFRRYAEQWRSLHPGWRHILWTEEELDGLEMANRGLYDDAERHQPRFRVPRMRSNIARLEILAQYGGVYVDSDVMCLRNIEPLLDGVRAFAAWSPNGLEHITNAVMGATPGHEFVMDALAGLEESVASRPGQGSWRQTGPHYLTAVYHRDPERLTVLPARTFYPLGMDQWRGDRRAHRTADLSGAYAVHEWASQRRPLPIRIASRLVRAARRR